jgi:hypothetical protein
MVRSPPMAYVEEVFPEEPIQAPPKHLLFTVPDNWQPPSSLLGEVTKAATVEQQGHNTMEAQLDEFPTCYIEEEVPKRWIFRMLHSQLATILPEPWRAIRRRRQRNRVRAQQWSSRAGNNKRGHEIKSGGTSKEGGEVLAPPPISTMQEQWHVPPPFFHPEHLELMFDLRSQMVDQVHRGTLMSQRIDMLYDAFSNAPAGQRCPTCAQPYVMPAREGTQDEDVDMATSEATG